jgi:hypothetical protein
LAFNLFRIYNRILKQLSNSNFLLLLLYLIFVNRMKKYISILILLLISLAAYSQSDFSVIKTDDSDFPMIDVWIRADSGSISKDVLKLYSEDNLQLPYSLEKITSLKHDKESAILYLFFLSGNSDENSAIAGQIKEHFESKQSGYKMNLALIRMDKFRVKTEFLSPEFSADYDFFYNQLDKYAFDSDTLTSVNPVVQNMMRRLINEDLKTTNYSIFMLGSRFRANKNEPLIHQLIRSDIHIYSLLSDSLDVSNESNLISLCSRTGGMYTKSEIENYRRTLNTYIDDALLYASVSGFEFFKLQFKTRSKAKKNYAIISNGEKELSFVFYRKRLLGETEMYQLFLIISGIIIFYLLLMYVIQKRKIHYLKIKTKRKETIPDSDKKVVLNVQSAGLSQKYELSEKRYTIGRHKSNDIVVENETLSAFHAEIFKEQGLYMISDKGSTNGVYADGERVIKEKLRKDMLLKLGEVYIKISYE